MSRADGLRRGRAVMVYAAQLLAERGAEGIPATELEASLRKRLGGSRTANKILMIRAAEKGLVFGKSGTIASHCCLLRYFDTQEHCDACPIARRLTDEEKKAAGIVAPRRPRQPQTASERAGVAIKGSRIPTGEPIITERTKVTVIPTRPDPRFYVPPTHRGELMADWQAKRGEAATC